jgi:hypothetical protein
MPETYRVNYKQAVALSIRLLFISGSVLNLARRESLNYRQVMNLLRLTRAIKETP